MKKIFLAALMAMTFAGCHAQEGGFKKDFSSPQGTTTQNKPQERWKVNKRYDDNGNLIGYDSTYSWSYSSKGAANSDADADSMLNAFRRQFNGFPSFFSPHFGDQLSADSLFFSDFNSTGGPMQKWGNNFFDMGKMMRRLDSLGSSLLDDNFPGMETKQKSSLPNGYRL